MKIVVYVRTDKKKYEWKSISTEKRKRVERRMPDIMNVKWSDDKEEEVEPFQKRRLKSREMLFHT